MIGSCFKRQLKCCNFTFYMFILNLFLVFCVHTQDSRFNHFPPHYGWFQGLRYGISSIYSALRHYPPDHHHHQSKAEWTPREPLALHCPTSMTPMWPEETKYCPDPRRRGLRQEPKASLLHLIVVFCFSLFLCADDFLAKYCIFSQEKLAEYRRAFEEVSWHENRFIL